MDDFATQLENILKTGTENDARDFVMQHLNEFPEETRNALAVDIFNSAMDEITAGNKEIQSTKEKLAILIDEAGGNA